MHRWREEAGQIRRWWNRSGGARADPAVLRWNQRVQVRRRQVEVSRPADRLLSFPLCSLRPTSLRALFPIPSHLPPSSSREAASAVISRLLRRDRAGGAWAGPAARLLLLQAPRWGCCCSPSLSIDLVFVLRFVLSDCRFGIVCARFGGLGLDSGHLSVCLCSIFLWLRSSVRAAAGPRAAEASE